MSDNPIVKTQRIEYIDLAKGFCILLVVLYHLSFFYKVLLPLDDFWITFRLPLYFFLSGCFFKAYGGFVDFVKRKTNKLLIPFVFFYILCAFLIPNIAVRMGINMGHLPFSQFFSALYEEMYPAGPIWFLLCLFEINILFYLIYLVSQKHQQGNVILILLTSLIGCFGIYLGLHSINIPYNLDSALSALPFFALGYVVFRKTDLLKPNRFDKYLPITITLAFLVALLFGRYFSFATNEFPDYAWLTVYPCGALGVYGVVMLSKLLKHLPLVSYYGRYSIMILVTHDTLFHFYAGILNRFGLEVWPMLLINFGLTMLSYLAIIPFMRRFMPHVTAQKDVIKV